MHKQTHPLVALFCGALISAAGFNLLTANSSARAADDTRDQRMNQDQWSTGDRVRDALDHLKKAESELNKVADDEGSKVAKDAAKLTGDARSKVDQFVSELDAKGKLKKKDK